MDTVPHLFNKIFENTAISDKDKATFVGIYMISIYKSALEILIGLEGNNKELLKQVNDFFESRYNKLTPGKKEIYTKALEREKNRHLQTLTEIIIKNSPEDTVKQLQNNLKKYSS